MSNTKQVEVFLQGEGLPKVVLIRLAAEATVADLMRAAQAAGIASPNDPGHEVRLEDADEPCDLALKLHEAGIRHRGRVHIHRCRRISVTVNFNVRSEKVDFPPSATVRRLKRWADDVFKLSEVDASDHALQLCGSATRPDEDVHLGVLATHATCSVCFDLVPKKRVEG